MATASSTAAGTSSSFDLGENQKRWMVIGICLNRVLLPVLRDFVSREITNHYTALKGTHRIDTQVFKGPHLAHDGPFKLNYGSINNNLGMYGKTISSYNYEVKSPEDLAKLYLEPRMAKFTGFDNSCDLSAVLGILANASIFHAGMIPLNAKTVRSKVRNEWGHCNFDHWTDPEFQNCFQLMEKLLHSLGLPRADETKILSNLCDWKKKGVELCLGCPVDKDLMKLVGDQVTNLIIDVELMKKSDCDEAHEISIALQNISREIDQRITEIENRIEVERREQLQKNQAFSVAIEDLSDDMTMLEVRQDESEETIAELERKQNVLVESVTSKVEVLERKTEETDSRVKVLESSLEGRLNTSAKDVAFLAPKRNSSFCGRENELTAIAANLKENTSSCADTVIYGLGGVGKTSLAVEFIWRHKNDYPGGVYWISGENNRAFQSSVREMALEMQITTFDNDFSFTLTKALAWLKKQSQLWCLVVDNLDELEMSEDMRKLLRGKWKQGAHGHIIITTRREPREIRKEAGVEERSCVELKCFTQEESVEFIRKQTGKMEEEHSEIEELASELDGLPLALDQATAYMRYLPCSIKDYVEQFRVQKGELLKKMKAQEPDECTSSDRLAVHTTWLMNFHHITNSDRYNKEVRVAATLVMEVFAYLGPDDIPSVVINEGLPPVECPGVVDVISSPFGRKEVMSLLTNLSLFQQFGENSCCVHRLVQEVIRGWMHEKRKEDTFNREFFTTEFAFIAGTRFLHHAFVNTRSPVEVCERFGERNVIVSVENIPLLTLWRKLASHGTYLQEHLLKFTAKNEESASALLHTEETVRMLNEVAMSFSVAREKVKAQEIQKRKLEFLAHLKQPPSEQTLKVLLYFNMPLKHRYYKLISHCMRERPSNREDSSEAENNADQLRGDGNLAVRSEEYEKALRLYTKAIELNSKDYRLYSSRALCHLKLNKPRKALSDCIECLSLKRNYSTALHRKAWALHELVKSGSDHLKGCALATAALALHLNPKENFQNPPRRYEVIENSNQLDRELQMPQPNKTLLLLEGVYYVHTEFAVVIDLQIVGLGTGAVLICEHGFVVHNAKCYLENVMFPRNIPPFVLDTACGKCTINLNVFFPRGIPPLVCQGQTAAIGMSHCQISAGYSGCKDYPECNGGQGCIAALIKNPLCHRTNRCDTPEVSGIKGDLAGILVCDGGVGYIDHCRIFECGGGGGLVHGEGSRLFVRNCEVYSNYQAGLEAREGAELVATENKVYDNGTHGFLLGPDTGRCLIRSNKIFENHKEGVAVLKSKQEVTVDSNEIYHNMAFGFSLQDCHLSITNNKIFENGFWGILLKSRTSARIKENDIFLNKCGGIFIGINFDGKIIIQSNVVRDHAGPWLEYQDMAESFGNESTFSKSDPIFHLPPRETTYYSVPPTIERNQEFNNTEGLLHPAGELAGVQSRCCHCSKELRDINFERCPECYIAVYCGRECMDKHWPKHKSLCSLLKSRYSATAEFIPLPITQGIHLLETQILRSHLKGIEEGLLRKRDSHQAFIVKIQTQPLNFHPNQLLHVYDRSLNVDDGIQSSVVFNMVMEFGVLEQLNKLTTKKAFFWASFVDEGKKLNIFLNHLAPYQEW